jgi:hypothetical protein
MNSKKEKGMEFYYKIDYEKAFDSINWDFWDKTLRHYEFGENIRKCVKILYTDVQTMVICPHALTDLS